MSRGPGKTRRFNKRDFVLAEVYRAGSLADTFTYENRNKEAQYKARLLRNAGNYARVVNGSGWTAIYIGIQTAGMPVIQAPPPPLPSPKATFKPEKDVKRLDKTKRFDALELMNKGRDIPKELGIKTIKKAPDVITTSEPKIKRSINIRNVFLKNGGNELMNKYGLGYFGKTPTKETIEQINDAKIVKGQELVDLLESIPVQRSTKAFKTWLESNVNLNAKYQKTPKLENLFLVMLGNKDVNEENLKDVELFVIYSDDKPVYFQFADGEFSKAIQRVEAKVAEENKFEGWDKFQIRNM